MKQLSDTHRLDIEQALLHIRAVEDSIKGDVNLINSISSLRQARLKLNEAMNASPDYTKVSV